jgi:hypothetical protein
VSSRRLTARLGQSGDGGPTFRVKTFSGNLKIDR